MNHVKEGHGALCKDDIRALTKLLIKDPCPFGQPAIVDRNPHVEPFPSLPDVWRRPPVTLMVNAAGPQVENPARTVQPEPHSGSPYNKVIVHLGLSRNSQILHIMAWIAA